MAIVKLIERKPKKKPEPDLSKLKIGVVDNGLFVGVAQHLAQFYGKVYYCRPVAGAFLKGAQGSIGKRIPGIEWTDDPEDLYDKVDDIFFPDINYGKRAASLLRQGRNVCGALNGERMELDKIFFLEECRKYLKKHPGINVHVPETLPFTGLDATLAFLEKQKETMWIKGADKNRGDFETMKHDGDFFQTEIFFDDMRAELGTKRSKEIILLVQKNIPDAIEIGVDGFRLGNRLAPWGCCGIEEKATYYVGKVFKTSPAIFTDSQACLGASYEELGYRAPYSNENRITKDGKVYVLDECCRCGNPPTSGLLKLYGDRYAQAVHSLCSGELPNFSKPTHSHFAEIILSSTDHVKHELHIPEIPKHLQEWVVIRNITRRENGESYCVLNDCGGHFASVTALGNSAEEVCNLAEERASQLKICGLEYQKGMYETMKKKITMAKEYADISI